MASGRRLSGGRRIKDVTARLSPRHLSPHTPLTRNSGSGLAPVPQVSTFPACSRRPWWRAATSERLRCGRRAGGCARSLWTSVGGRGRPRGGLSAKRMWASYGIFIACSTRTAACSGSAWGSLCHQRAPSPPFGPPPPHPPNPPASRLSLDLPITTSPPRLPANPLGWGFTPVSQPPIRPRYRPRPLYYALHVRNHATLGPSNWLLLRVDAGLESAVEVGQVVRVISLPYARPVPVPPVRLLLPVRAYLPSSHPLPSSSPPPVLRNRPPTATCRRWWTRRRPGRSSTSRRRWRPSSLARGCCYPATTGRASRRTALCRSCRRGE